MNTAQVGEEMVGRQVRIERCEASIHDGNEGCVCGLIGKRVTIERIEHAPTKISYKIKQKNKYIMASEITPLFSRLFAF